MNVQLEQQGAYEFAAAPQAVGAKGRYRDDPSASQAAPQHQQGAAFLLMDKSSRNKLTQTAGSQQQGVAFLENEDYNQSNGGTAFSAFYEPLEYEEPDEEEEPDFYVDKPPEPEFKPKERGVDFDTQIEDYELFDFQLEVEPILQVLVGKTVDQARMELIEESEREELRQHKTAYEIKRNAELMVTQRMEAAFNRRQEEQDRRNWQHKLHREQERLAHKKLLSRQLVKRALGAVKASSLADLEREGFLRDEMLLKLRANFLPWMMNATIEERESQISADSILEEFADQLQAHVVEIHAQHQKNEADRKKKILNEREQLRLRKEERKRKKAEWTKKSALNAERQVILDALMESVIAKAEKVENIRDCEFADITGDQHRNPVSKKASSLQDSLKNRTALDCNRGSELFTIKDLTENLLHEIKQGLLLKLSEEQKEMYETAVLSLQNISDEEDANTARLRFVKQLVENEALVFQQNPTLAFLRDQLTTRNSFASRTLSVILSSLFEHIARGIRPDVIMAHEPAADGSFPPPIEEKPQPVKVRILFENTTDIIVNKANIIIRIRTPFLSKAELEARHDAEQLQQALNNSGAGSGKGEEQLAEVAIADEVQKLSESQEILIKQTEQQNIEACKYDELVDIFNGEGYLRTLEQNIRTSSRHSLVDDFVAVFPLAANESRHILLFDERTQYYLLPLLLKLTKDLLGSKADDLSSQSFEQLFSSLEAKAESDFLSLILPNERLAQIPVFDIDFGFNYSAE